MFAAAWLSVAILSLAAGGADAQDNCASATVCEICQMLTPVIGIAAIQTASEVAPVCTPSDPGGVNAGKVATTCTDVVLDSPGCKKPAPEDQGSYCEPFPNYGGCTFTAAGCSVFSGSGTCTRNQAVPYQDASACKAEPDDGSTVCQWDAASCTGTSKTEPTCVPKSGETGTCTLKGDWSGCVEGDTTCDFTASADGSNADDCALTTKKIWSTFMGVKHGSCDSATGCVNEAGEVQPTACANPATGCEVTDAQKMEGDCTLTQTQPAEEIGLVTAVAAKTEACPSACVYTPGAFGNTGAAFGATCADPAPVDDPAPASTTSASAAGRALAAGTLAVAAAVAQIAA